MDGRMAIAAMGNPASPAITHVLHNKQEFPLAAGMDVILVLSIGIGTGGSSTSSGAHGCNTPMPWRSPSREELARDAGGDELVGVLCRKLEQRPGDLSCPPPMD
jgi:hypothetical protein